ncbi:hypothetical protein [Paraclostridium tenue]|uniref:DUF3829 domain-containing protein n=1 Tax=Paraclostridium tenue TaxID=1737 RepID=A0ABN1M8N0_9FIRM
MNILKKKSILIMGGVIIALGIVGCNQNQKKVENNSFKGYEGIGYEPIYHIEKNEAMKEYLEDNKKFYESDYDCRLINSLNKESKLSLEDYDKTLYAIYAKFLYAYTSMGQIEETKLDKEFLDLIINKLIILQELGKKSNYKDKVCILDTYFESTINAMKELENNLDNKNYALYLDYKGRARICMQELTKTCSNEIIAGSKPQKNSKYEPKKFDSVSFQVAEEIDSMSRYLISITEKDEVALDEDYVIFIKRLEKIQKSINENSTNKSELEKLNKQFDLVYKEIDKVRITSRDNYEKASQQKETDGKNVTAIRNAKFDLASKINDLQVLFKFLQLF